MSPVAEIGEGTPEAAELLMNFINENADRTFLEAGAVVGGADDPQQQRGVVAIMPAGNQREEDTRAVRWRRLQLRCMGPSLLHAARIGNHLEDLLDGRYWMLVDDEFGRTFMVHQISVTTGPSGHIDSTETHEYLLFCTVCVGRDPVETVS